MDIKNVFESEMIDTFGVLDYKYVTETRKYLREKLSFMPKSVISFAIPYYTGKGKYISAYAVSRDYHKYMEKLSLSLGEKLKRIFPFGNFVLFADHSPIDERDAAARAGLGVIGKNGLLLTKKYSSFVFLGEVLTDVSTENLGYIAKNEITYCIDCGSCERACPMKTEGCDCISAITQKKGSLTKEEQNLLLKYNTIWGCDICQEVCPYTVNALREGTIYTKIPYFLENRTDELSLNHLNFMTDDEFMLRAYSWRGRETVRRNIELFEKNGK